MGDWSGTCGDFVCSDSLSAITALGNGDTRCRWKDEIDILHNQAKSNGTKITYMWLYSHVGIAGNEKADQEAKESQNDRTCRHESVEFKEFKDADQGKDDLALERGMEQHGAQQTAGGEELDASVPGGIFWIEERGRYSDETQDRTHLANSSVLAGNLTREGSRRYSE